MRKTGESESFFLQMAREKERDQNTDYQLSLEKAIPVAHFQEEYLRLKKSMCKLDSCVKSWVMALVKRTPSPLALLRCGREG